MQSKKPEHLAAVELLDWEESVFRTRVGRIVGVEDAEKIVRRTMEMLEWYTDRNFREGEFQNLVCDEWR